MLDDHSRYAWEIGACGDERETTLRERLIQVFRRYGLPLRLLTENGSAWVFATRTARTMRKTVFTGANKVVVGVLRDARVRAGLTQAELAERLGRDQSFVSLFEGSQRRLDIIEFRRLATALGRDPTELFAEISVALDATGDS